MPSGIHPKAPQFGFEVASKGHGRGWLLKIRVRGLTLLTKIECSSVSGEATYERGANKDAVDWA